MLKKKGFGGFFSYALKLVIDVSPVCTHRGSNEWTMELCIKQGLTNVLSDFQHGQFQTVVSGHGMGKLLQQASVPPPRLIHFRHAGQAASHYIQTVARARLDQCQTTAVGAVQHFHQGLYTLLAQSGMFSCVHDLQTFFQGQIELSSSPQSPGQLLGHGGRVSPKRADILPDHTETVDHFTAHHYAPFNAWIYKPCIYKWEDVVEKMVNLSLHGDITSTEVDGQGGKKLVHMGQSLAGQRWVACLQQRTQVALREG